MRSSLAEGLDAAVLALKDFGAGNARRIPGFLKKPGFYAAVVSGFLLLYGNFYLIQNRLAYAVCFQGREIALVASPRQGEEILKEVQRELEERLGQKVYLPAAPEFRRCSVPRKDMGAPGQLRSAFYSLPWLTDGVEIVIDGRPALVVEDREAAQRVLERLKKEYAEKLDGEELASVEFVERVALRSRPVAVGEISGEDDAFSLLKNGRSQVVKYRVKEGDSLWSIARAHGLLVEDLLRANPGLSERLDIDQEINLAAVRPLLSVRTVSSSVVKEAIPCEVEVRLDSRLRRGSTRVIRSGEDGEKEVVYRIVRENGRVVSREAVSSRVLKEPVSRIVAQGTAGVRYYASAYSAYRASRGTGSGVLSWPVSGGISSGYGYRGGEFHAGIDITAGRGAPVRAAAGGRVVEAGWGGGYGNTVVIDHGNGLATRYAHLSSISVRVGEAVGSGEVIGSVGSTGRATGPHLHFEVMVNGSRVNPLNYLR